MKALVTGAGGFLGGAIARMLKARGDDVRSYSRGAYPELAAAGIEHVQGSLSDRGALTKAMEGCDVVFHVAAKAGIWGPSEDYHEANVTGTENVIAACRAAGVNRLVYTSSPSVVFDGNDMEGADESAPYPEHYHTHYPKTKAIAERAVLAANGPALSTVSLRPHLIWGPGDNHLVPRLVARAKEGKLRRIGKAEKKVDSVYIDNAAEAHLQAADALGPDAACAGKAYFISNGEPIPVWDLVNKILAAAGAPQVTKTIPAGVAYAAGAILETIHGVLGLKAEPRMTRFVAKELATAHWFDLSAAKRDFGYDPKVTLEEGLKRLQAEYQKG